MYYLVLSTPGEEGGLRSLLAGVLKSASWLYPLSESYPFYKLFSLSDVNHSLFDVSVVCDKGGFYNVFKYAGGESFEEEQDGLFISYGVSG